MKNLLDLFAEIKSAHANLPGWCVEEKAITLASAVILLRPALTVEIGIFGGKSFIPMAMAHHYIGVGKIIGIDPWSRQASVDGETKENSDWWGSLDHDAIYRAFMGEVSRLGISDVCQIIRNKSDDVQSPGEIGLLHIDGSHTHQAVRDADRFASRVAVGGMCFMDDIDWVGGGPKKAVGRIMDMGFKMLYKMDTGAMFQKVR